jgi:tetratricopeptide (TPR) repeat protein
VISGGGTELEKAEYQVGLADAYYMSGALTQAINECGVALAILDGLTPTRESLLIRAGALTTLGWIYRYLGRLDEALSSFETVKQLSSRLKSDYLTNQSARGIGATLDYLDYGGWLSIRWESRGSRAGHRAFYGG